MAGLTDLPEDVLQQIVAHVGLRAAYDDCRLHHVCRALRQALRRTAWPAPGLALHADEVSRWCQRIGSGLVCVLRVSAELSDPDLLPRLGSLAACEALVEIELLFPVSVEGAVDAGIPCSALAALADRGALRHLESLHIGLGLGGYRHLRLESDIGGALLPFATLRDLSLRPGFLLRSSSAHALGTALPRLASLEVGSIESDLGTFFSLARACASLQSLSITDGYGTLDRGCYRALGSMPALRSLWLGGYSIDRSVAGLADGGGAAALASFRLTHAVPKELPEVLEALAGLPALESLSMRRPEGEPDDGGIQVVGRVHWRALGRLARLRSLTLACRPPEAAEEADGPAALAGLTRLEELDLTVHPRWAHAFRLNPVPPFLCAAAASLAALPRLRWCGVRLSAPPNPAVDAAASELAAALGDRLRMVRGLPGAVLRL